MYRLLFILSLLPLTVFAKPMPGGEPPFGGMPPHQMEGHKGGEESQMPIFLKKIKLTEKQEADIKSLVKSNAGFEAKFEEEHRLRVELHKLSFSSDYTDEKSKALIEKSLNAHKEIALQKAKLDNSIFKLLTSEQQEQLKAELGRFEH